MPTSPDVLAFLAKTVLFSALPGSVLEALAGSLIEVTLRKGEVLFEPGAVGDTAFLVRSGLVHVVDATTAEGRVLGEVGRGHHLGEMAVLTGEARAAGAVAAVDTVLYAVPGALLRLLFAEHPILHARLSLGLMRALQARERAVTPGVRTCAVVAVGSTRGRSLAFTLALAETLATTGDEHVAVLDCSPPSSAHPAAMPETLDDMTQTLQRLVVPVTGPHASVSVVGLGGATPASAPIPDLVAELRRRHDRVLVHAELPWSGVVPHAVAQCDALQWVIDAADPDAEATCQAAFDEVAQRVRRPPAPGTVLLAPGGTASDRSRLAARSIPMGDPAAPFVDPAARRALRALARALTARQTALVLGAGGAKGFAHIGALGVFERHEIEFDAVAGASIGAIVGAGIAMGWTTGAIEELLLGIASNPWRTLLDPRIPTEAFFTSRKKRELIALYCGDRRIEDLALPFLAVAGDLVRLAPVVFDSGSLALALDATSAIPTVFRPVRHEGQLLVDGWVCNPLPADVVRVAGYDRVVGIDLSPRRDVPERPPPMTKPVGLAGRFRILAIAMRAMELASQEHVARTIPLVDVLVRPALDGFSSADLEGATAMRDRGAEAAEAALPALRALATQDA